MKKIITVLLVMFSFTNITLAASKCSYQEEAELNSKASNIKFMYEIKEEDTTSLEGVVVPVEYLSVNVLNLTNEFYVAVTSNKEGMNRTLTYSDVVSGVASIKDNDLSEVGNYVFVIYTSGSTSCPGTRIKTGYLTTPRYNRFSEFIYCDGVDDFNLCNKYVTSPPVSEEEFMRALNQKIEEQKEEDKPQEEEKKEDKNSILDFIKQYKWYFAGGLGLLVLITLAVIVIKKNIERKRTI